jgi:hypothetical protein
MIHLFKKVYLCLDHSIDMRQDRVVVSKQNGVECISLIDNGLLIHSCATVDDLIGQAFSSFEEFFNMMFERTTQTLDPVIIYADQIAFLSIAAAWFKLILPNTTDDDINSLVHSYVFRHNMFYRSRWSTTAGRYDMIFNVDLQKHNTIFSDKPIKSDGSFVEKVLPWVGVEFVLATYLSTGQMKEHLKAILKTLIRKDLEKYLFEAKELFLVHYITDRFASKLGLDKQYTISNAHDIINDASKYARLFLDGSLWSYPFMSYPSSSQKNVYLENFTRQDIEDLKEFIAMCTETWTDEVIHNNPNSELNKLSFIAIFDDFTDEKLNDFIEIESTFNYVTGTFFSIDQVTVNHFLVHDILTNYKSGDIQRIEKYSLA